MKKISAFIFLLVITLGVFQANASDLQNNSINLKGNSNTGFGNYEIKELPLINKNGETMRAFELTYEKAQKTVTIYLDERANCKDYIVRSKNLEVAYRCKKNSFGVQMVPYKHLTLKPELNARFLALPEFGKQQVIAEGGLPLESTLDLIASYYPNLLISPDLLN